MTLIGKAKEDFLIKVYYQEDTNQASDESIKEKLFYHSQKWIERQDKRLINQLIIDFFDEKGFNISIETENDTMLKYVRGFESYVSILLHGNLLKLNSDCLKNDVYETRKEAIEKAIEKANEVYNHRYS